MSYLHALDQKIADLQKKKALLEQKQATALYKHLTTLLKEDFSPDLVRALLEETWAKASPDQKEGWRAATQKFRVSRNRGSRKAA